jgi:hypothetical protein
LFRVIWVMIVSLVAVIETRTRKVWSRVFEDGWVC